MEEQHLSFYKEVSLVLSKEDAQLNKVYKCGECSLNIQGKVSIVQHLLTHENRASTPSTPRSMELTNGKATLLDGAVALVNGFTNHAHELNGEDLDCLGAGDGIKGGKQKVFEKREQIQIEINPLDLISSLIEEDMKSDNPLLPTQHFLLGHSNSVNEENYFNYEDYYSGENLGSDGYPNDEEGEAPLMNGLSLTASTDTYYDSSPAPGVFQCNQCNDAFKYQYLLTAHKKLSHQGNILTPFKCHVCGNEFTTLGDLKRHSLSNHSTDLSHFCQICGHAFVDPIKLKQHLVDHGKSSRKLPPTPGKEVITQSPTEKTSCDICSIEFSSKSDLTRHIVRFQGTCNPNKIESLRCATCGDQMASLEALKEHRKNVHPQSPTDDPMGGKKGFQCDYCGKNFSCRSNLRDHLVVHTGEKPYPCDICGKAFSFIHNMKTHRLTHNEGRNEMCPYCDKAYKSKISLYYHMKKGNCRGLSTKEVPEGFQRCTECLQMFASEDRFHAHKAKGTCQMSYRCIHCGIRCSSQDKLDKHVQKGICTKSSSSSHPSERRKKHRRRHDNRSEEPVCCARCNNYNRDCCCTFSCRICNKRVFSIGAYITHQRFHLNPPPPTPATTRPTPLPRPRKDRIRAAIMEKRRRKRKRKGCKKKRYSPPSESPPILSQNDPFDSPPSSVPSALLTHPTLSSPTEKEAAESGELKGAPSSPACSRITSLSEVCTAAAAAKGTSEESMPQEEEVGGLPPQEPALSVNTPSPRPSGLVEEEDDSNSGSLTDLSPFIAPNLLKPVHSAPTASVGGSGQG